MKEYKENGEWNYMNKFHLLQAEMHAAKGHNDRAKVSFNSAISAARSSRFVHEQGLACERFALFSIKNGNKEDAANLLEQARECYTKWGSGYKVESVARQLEKINRP